MDQDVKLKTKTEKIAEYGGEFLTTFNFEMNAEGASIGVMGCAELLAVPESTGGVRGVIYMNDKIIPVVDLKMKFGSGTTSITGQSCILLAEHVCGDKQRKVGIVVADISEVLDMIGHKMDKTIENALQAGPDEPIFSNSSELSEVLMNIERIMKDVDFDSFHDESA